MSVHTCTRCPLRFSNRNELADHMSHDHGMDEQALEQLHYPGAHEAAPLYRSFSSDDGVHRVLVVANRTLGSAAIAAAMRVRAAERERLSVYVLVPAPSDESGVAVSRWRLRQALDQLRELGITAHGSVGGPSPLDAVAQVLGEEPIDEILLGTFGPGLSRWLEADVPTALERRFHIPVTLITAEAPPEVISAGLDGGQART